MPPLTKRISTGTEILMKGVAWFVYFVNFLINILGDLFGIGEILSMIFMAFSYTGFFLWFAFNRVSLLDKAYAKDALIKFVVSEIPIVNVFFFSKTKKGFFVPGIRAMVENAIEQSRAEDQQKNEVTYAKLMSKQQRMR